MMSQARTTACTQPVWSLLFRIVGFQHQGPLLALTPPFLWHGAKFDYDQENLTELLWVSEGLSVYDQDLLLLRAGLMSRERRTGQKTVSSCLLPNQMSIPDQTRRLVDRNLNPIPLEMNHRTVAINIRNEIQIQRKVGV
jgi:hypothetical protein